MRGASLSKNHEQWLRALHRKKHRREEQCFLAEGFNSLGAALESHLYPLRELIVDDGHKDAVMEMAPPGLPVLICSNKTLGRISTEETPQGVIAVCSERAFSLGEIEVGAPCTILYLDRISDPGNLGTILRTAAWFGVRRVFLSPSCVDPFSTKVIRSSAGMIFFVELYRSVSGDEVFRFAEEEKFRTIAAIPFGGDSLRRLGRASRNIILLGHEREGLSEEIRTRADLAVSIPGAGTAESLNVAVAASLLLYEISGEI